MKVAETKDVPPGRAITVEVGGQNVALFNVDGAFYAVANDCTHAGGPLAEGPVDDVASVGTRPTFDLSKPLLEVHLFDFERDIYGEYIHVDFIEHLRSEEKFEAVDDLVAQMRRDEENARSALAKAGDQA